MVSFKEVKSFDIQMNVPLDELSASVKAVYLASLKVDQLVVSLVSAEG